MLMQTSWRQYGRNIPGIASNPQIDVRVTCVLTDSSQRNLKLKSPNSTWFSHFDCAYILLRLHRLLPTKKCARDRLSPFETMFWIANLCFSAVSSCRWQEPSKVRWWRWRHIRFTRPTQDHRRWGHFRSVQTSFQIGCSACYQAADHHEHSQKRSSSKLSSTLSCILTTKIVRLFQLLPTFDWWRKDSITRWTNFVSAVYFVVRLHIVWGFLFIWALSWLPPSNEDFWRISRSNEKCQKSNRM